MRTQDSLAFLRLLGVAEPTARLDTVEAMHARRFVENVTEARANGYDFVCAECGAGILDESDEHEPDCKLGSEQ